MGRQVIKQPDGKLAIFSSNSDTLVMWDATRDDVIDHFVQLAADDARRSATRIVDHVEAGNPDEAYYQFTMTWDEAVEMDREHGGSWPDGA